MAHFHDKGKPHSSTLLKNNNSLRNALPFADTRYFEEQTCGFIVAPACKQIMAEAGYVACYMAKYKFLLQGQDFDSIHPSLRRQAILNTYYGLYEVIPGIDQVLCLAKLNIDNERVLKVAVHGPEAFYPEIRVHVVCVQMK